MNYAMKIRALAERLIDTTADMDDDREEWEGNILARLQALVLDVETEKDELAEQR